jgi:phage FluMu protein Com
MILRVYLGGKIKVKCPKCKKEMKEIIIEIGYAFTVPIQKRRLICSNENCNYYGIPRLNLKEFRGEDD